MAHCSEDNVDKMFDIVMTGESVSIYEHVKATKIDHYYITSWNKWKDLNEFISKNVSEGQALLGNS